MIKLDRRCRPALMTSVAMMGLVLGAGTASAEQLSVAGTSSFDAAVGENEDIEREHTAWLLADSAELAAHRLELASFPQQQTITRPDLTELDPNILIALPGTPTTARDPENITGIGQMIVSTPGAGGGVSLGLCTGSLINPRTVLFAAHCVNSRPATAYGSDSGGVAIGFGFNAANNTTQAGAPAGTSPLLNWLFGTTTRAPNTTSTSEFFYTVNGIAYNPLSLEPASRGFLYGDVAIASLDTPATDIPLLPLLFSPLPAPSQISGATGTGYHVTLAGYGRNGTGTSGSLPIDFRRRLAENWLGALASIVDFETNVFGGSDPALIQNLYFIDFDDPARGTPGAYPLDFNAFRDNGLPNEGGTAGGDSGGPLILDRTFARQLVIGVLSGGYTRFFGGQPANGYGTVSFYQPLYLYWDWIAANNPYRYVGAAAGNGNWEDPTHWVSLQDPNYFVIGANGELINGVPAETGEQNAGTAGKFGQVCIQGIVTGAIGNNVCRDVSNGSLVGTPGGIGSEDPQPTYGLNNNRGSAVIENPGAATQPGTAEFDVGVSVPEAQAAAQPTPAPTIANGLPGATNFVPNNTAGNRLEGILPRYFDVTLSNAGTTTLSSAVTIDRLTLRNSAGLTIAGAGNLTSLIDVNQIAGTMTVNGRLNSVGDYTILSGLLQGNGTVTAPFVTSVAGTIAPGTVGTVGTLTIDGNLIMSSGTLTLIDLAAESSDLIVVNGAANIGGQVGLGTGMTGQVNGLGRQFTILTATDGVTGTFAAQNLSPILSQVFTYQENAVLLEIEAASYTTVISPNDPAQAAYAQLFDQNRSNGALAGLYALDFATADTIRNTFNLLAPVNEQAVRSLAAQSVNLLQNFTDTRLREADKDKAGGKIAITGRPLELAKMSLAPAGQPLGGALMAMQDGAGETELREANLPDNVALFLAAGIVSGDSDSLPGYEAGSQVAGQSLSRTTEFSGWYLSSGVEFYPGENTMVGVSGYYSSFEADVPLSQRVDNETYAASLYLRHKFATGPVIDGQFSMGSMGFDTRRTVQFLGTTQSLASSSDDLLVSGALGLSYDLQTGLGTISPGIEARYASVDLSRVSESGGTLGLSVERERFESKQVRAGFDFETEARTVQFNATAQYVHEFEDGPQLLAANFTQGTGPDANFVIGQADSDWLELGLSAQIGRGPVQFGLGVESTFGRDSADARAFRASLNYRF